MANYPADEYWDIDGVSLQTYAFNIETWGGSRHSVPPLRGENQLVPRLTGRIWVPKKPDQRLITFAMWVIGANEDGEVDEDSIALFNHNWDKLKGLFWRETQYPITRRWRELDEQAAEGYIIRSATAMGEFAGGLELSMLNNRTSARFTVDVLLADPFFYDGEEAVL